MYNISAILLTLGEKTTQRAIDSLNQQSVKTIDLIIVENVSPFHKALNYGVSQVKTDFFLQLDSDMILDKDCIYNLMMNMNDSVGIVVGQLRDNLMGAESGIKLIRTKCFDIANFRNTISPDTDFYHDISREGWHMRNALYLTHENDYGKYWGTFGEHQPNYTPLYTYRRYYLLGRRYRYRRDLYTFLWRLEQLKSINHKYSLIAQIAICHGIFSYEENDQLNINLYSSNSDFELLSKFLNTHNNNYSNGLDISSLNARGTKEIFEFFYKTAIELREYNSFPCFNNYFNLIENKCNSNGWIAKVGLCHGLFSHTDDKTTIKEKYELLKEIL